MRLLAVVAWLQAVVLGPQVALPSPQSRLRVRVRARVRVRGMARLRLG